MAADPLVAALETRAGARYNTSGKPLRTEGVMADTIVSAEDAEAQFKGLLELVKDGNEVLIAEGDKVFARIAPVERLRAEAAPVAKARPKRIMGLSRGLIEVSDDFDDPLPDSFWSGENGEKLKRGAVWEPSRRC